MEMDDLDALLDEVIKPRLQPDDVTVERIRKRKHVSESRAAEAIEKLMDAKQLIYLGLRRCVNGHEVHAWRIVERKKTK